MKSKHTEARHTPGQWRLSKDGRTVFASEVDGAGVLIRGVEQVIPHIAYIARNGFAATFSEQQANANLITAAPDADRILRHLLEYIESGEPTIHFDGLMPDDGCDGATEDQTLADAIRRYFAKRSAP